MSPLDGLSQDEKEIIRHALQTRLVTLDGLGRGAGNRMERERRAEMVGAIASPIRALLDKLFPSKPPPGTQPLADLGKKRKGH